MKIKIIFYAVVYTDSVYTDLFAQIGGGFSHC